ncbi:BPL-N domain-containing protein [Chromobacterium phragmitis]|nr:BPL-N domain-containing protein [Chromobacterium phragmitis]
MKTLLALALLLFTCSAPARDVGIFNGAGVCPGCAEAVAAFFDPQRDTVQYLNESNLDSARLKRISLYVQPGGSDDIDETLDALRPAQVQALRRFVADGGGYLGICAGAYLAARYSSAADKKPAYGLIALPELNAETASAKPSLLPIRWGGRERMAYNQSGPHMGKTPPPGASVLARYRDTRRIAALSAPYGRGKVVLIGPHLEADASWYREDGLSLAHGLNQDLFRQALSSFPD